MGFREATRQNITSLPSQTITEGGRLYFRLPKVGLLSKLILTIQATIDNTAGTGHATQSERGPWNLIKRIKLVANSGASIYDVSGYGTYVINNLLKKASAPNISVIDRTLAASTYSFPATDGDGTMLFNLEIPIAINDRDPIGLLLLQNNATEMVLEVEFNSAGGANAVVAPYVLTGTATSAFSAGTCGVAMEYFTVPRRAEDYPALNVIHQWLEQQDTVTGTGAFTKSLLRGNTYMRLAHYLTLNSALDQADVDKLRILYNQSEVPYTIDRVPQLFLQKMRYGMDLPKGTFVHDWYYSNGIPSLGDSRDFINSANITEFQSEVTIGSGATVTGNCYLNTLTEQLIRIA
jgi:hypothetical protein